MKKFDYKKNLVQVIESCPHELDKIEQIVQTAKKHGQDVHIEFREILNNDVWSSDEKVKLLILFGYSKIEIYTDYGHNSNKLIDAINTMYAIETHNLSGFEALMKIYKDIEKHSYGGLEISKDESYRNIFDTIVYNFKDENKDKYLKAVFDNLTIKDIKRLMIPSYEHHPGPPTNNKSIFVNIIDYKDLNLIKKYIDYVDDINEYLSRAVATGNIEIVKLFLEKGANVNYLGKEVDTNNLKDEEFVRKLTPLKTAIVKNDYEMAKFLINNGANVNLQFYVDDFIDELNFPQIDTDNGFDSINVISKGYRDDEQIEYIKVSSPLEYAIKVRKIKRSFVNSFEVYFNGEMPEFYNMLYVNTYSMSKQVKNRVEIVDLIFENMENKISINYNDLIVFTFITKNHQNFKKYLKFAIDNNYKFDFNYLFKMYFCCHLEQDNEISTLFMDLIKKYDKDGDLYLKLFCYYLESKGIYKYEFCINDFNKKLLSRIPQEKRKEICLVPYCKNILTLEYLLSQGYDINQVDENGRNILYYLLCNKIERTDLNNQEIELFKYLLGKIDLSAKDKFNKTVLYYAMQKFYTEKVYQYGARDNELFYAKKDCVGTRSNLEKAVVILISNMSKQDVCNDDIKKILEERLGYGSDYGDRISPECIYQHHKELFDALINKGFVLSDKMLDNIFTSLYSSNGSPKEDLFDKIDMNKTLDYLYQKLDYNLKIQKLDIEKDFRSLMDYINSYDITYDEFIKNIMNFYNKISSLNYFYENNIKKRFKPERYLQYAKEKYNTTYENLNSYLTIIIINGIKKFGNERLEDILEHIPQYNLNSYVINVDVGVKYSDYLDKTLNIINIDEEGNCIYGNEYFEADNIYENGNGNIVFSGGLVQYAILINNLSMIQLLQKKGASLKLLINRENHTFDYVHSRSMLKYIESVIGKKKDNNFDEAQKKLTLKK